MLFRSAAPRPVYMLAEHWFKGYPGVGLLTNKIGVVPAHTANAQRLLADEQRLVLVFPEGAKAKHRQLNCLLRSITRTTVAVDSRVARILFPETAVKSTRVCAPGNYVVLLTHLRMMLTHFLCVLRTESYTTGT